MAARATWKGVLSIGIINVPVGAIATAESAAAISFNQIAAKGDHADCKARINQKKICSKCEKEAKSDDLMKGYEVTKGQYVLVPDDALAKLKIESDRQIKLEAFINDTIPQTMIDATYYLVPDGKVTGPYFVIQRAMSSGKIGIGKIALNGKERQVAVAAEGDGFVMYVLTPSNEIRQIGQLEQFQSLPDVNPKEVELARMLIDHLEVDEYDLAEFTDSYKAGVRKVIDQLVAGEEITFADLGAAPQASTGSLMDALTASLASVKPKQVKAALPAKVEPVALRKAARKKTA